MDGRTNLTLICDNQMEGLEHFNISLFLTSNNPLVAMGKNTSTIQIMDIIGKHSCIITSNNTFCGKC